MQNLYSAFRNIKTEKEFYNFMNDLCTPTEIRELSERWNIAQLLLHYKMKQLDIRDKLNCSVATISRVARFIKEEDFNGYKVAVGRIYKRAG